jgi:signal transduction histidine kinase
VPLRNKQGTMTGMVAVMRDVTIRFTELKVLRERLAQVTEDRAGPP